MYVYNNSSVIKFQGDVYAFLFIQFQGVVYAILFILFIVCQWNFFFMWQAVWLVRSKQGIIVSLICGLDWKTGNEYRIFVEKCLVSDYLGGRRR